MKVQIREIVENFPDLLNLIRGGADHSVANIQTGATASSDSLIFISNRKQLSEAMASKAQAWVVAKDMAEHVPAQVKTVLVSPSPYLAMALVGKRHFPETRNRQILSGERIHASAKIASTAQLGADCIVGPGAVIGEHCVVGNGCVIGANSVLEPGVKLGDGCHIHPLVFIGHSCELGKGCEVQPNSTIGTEGFGYAQDKQFNHYRITHYGRVILEDNVHVGANVNIDRGTFEDSVIGAGTKIDNHCHFGHNITIGKNTLITAGMITAGSATIGNACVFGGRATVGGHRTIADRAHFGGLSVIGNDVKQPGEYGGFPLQAMKDELRTRASIKQLPELIKQVRKIMKHLGLKNEAKEQGE